MSKTRKSPLGKPTAYTREYSPGLLYAVPRSEARRTLRLGADLPFHGEDLWNAWELSWLDSQGRPLVAVAELRVPADSPNIIESKSLKLYLNSLALTRYASAHELRRTMAVDLAACANADVAVRFRSVADPAASEIGALTGICIDDTEARFELRTVDPQILRTDERQLVAEVLHSHLLRSNCPVTGQPDTGSILIRYRGPKIHRGTLLEYLVSFREHNAFHETCVEQVFVDIKSQCAPSQLTVYARYNRRGGIDINPFRSDFEESPANTRLWRQ